jgi:hypothetical protein
MLEDVNFIKQSPPQLNGTALPGRAESTFLAEHCPMRST